MDPLVIALVVLLAMLFVSLIVFKPVKVKCIGCGTTGRRDEMLLIAGEDLCLDCAGALLQRRLAARTQPEDS